MIVHLKLYAQLRDYLPGGSDPLPVDVPIASTVEEVIRFMRLPRSENMVFAVNGEKADRDRVLRDGDVLSVSPPIS